MVAQFKLKNDGSRGKYLEAPKQATSRKNVQQDGEYRKVDGKELNYMNNEKGEKEQTGIKLKETEPSTRKPEEIINLDDDDFERF